jgi:hypothetical protein
MALLTTASQARQRSRVPYRRIGGALPGAGSSPSLLAPGFRLLDSRFCPLRSWLISLDRTHAAIETKHSAGHHKKTKSQ